MKNNRRNLEIRREDFNSFFLWKVFWKLIAREKPLFLFLKVLTAGAVFTGIMLFIMLLGVVLGLGKAKKNNQRRANVKPSNGMRSNKLRVN